MTAPENQDVENGIQYCQGRHIQKQLSSELSSSDELMTKVRKPYTITKQRERWTEEEHQKFLEALKLYGRAWRRIEEHVGTKTAVQIRSHAQKYFAKLEREQAAGSSTGKSPSIDIPPPRPKRKPTHPYPRKAAELKSQPMLSCLAKPPEPVPVPKMKPGFSPYIPGSNPAYQPELKLFGHTVILPTAARAVRTGTRTPTEDQECSELLEGSAATGEVAAAPAMKKMLSNCMSELSMLDSSENDSPKGQCAEPDCCKTSLPPFEQVPAFGFTGRCYAKFLEGLAQGAAIPPFFLWQQAGFAAAAAAAWPGSTVNEVLRSMFVGMPSEACKPENSSALAAATIAAASTWWTLQGSMPPFLGQHVDGPSSTLRQDNGLQENKRLQDTGQPSRSGGISRQASFKRLAGGEDLERRVRPRSVSASNDPRETKEKQLPSRPPSSSSASDDVAGNNEISESQILDAEVAGARSDKDNGIKEDMEDTGIVRQDSSNFSGLQRSKHHVRCQKATRSQEGEQRREVSLGGRMAFRALFSHDRLPQSFRLKHDDSQDSAQIGSSDVESDNQCICPSSINNTDNTNTSNTSNGNNASNREQEEQASSSSKCQDCGRKPVRNESIGSNSSLLSPTGSSRSGFVPYRRAIAAVATRSSNRSTNDSRTTTSSSCGLENHLVGLGWCSVDEFVKQS